MKKTIKFQFTIFIGFLYLVSNLLNPTVIHAESSIHSKCGYIPDEGVNPPAQIINCLLTEVALANNIPPEIVKAIAEKESGWKQFGNTGEPLISKDGGIGMMQITWTGGFDVEKLKNDLVYNIEAGVQILNDNFQRKDLPKINDGSRNVIEHWYFAILGYNGIKPMNSPVLQNDGSLNVNAYQEKIFEIIRKQSLLDIKPIPFKTTDFLYNTESTTNIQFLTKQYELPIDQLNSSKYEFKPMDKGYITSNDVRLREESSTSSPIVKVLNKNDRVTVLDTFTFDQRNEANTFAWNLVRLDDGTEGYVAASYINNKSSNDDVSQNGNNEPVTVSVNKVWTIEFNETVDRNSVHNDTIYILDSNLNIHPTEVVVENKNVVIEPLEAFKSNQTYSLYIKRVKSATGIPLAEEIKKDFTIE